MIHAEARHPPWPRPEGDDVQPPVPDKAIVGGRGERESVVMEG